MQHMKARARAAILGFGRRVRDHRVAAGMSQREFARRARIGAKFVGQIERGTSNPSLESMVIVACALDCSLTDLLPGEETVPSLQVRVDDMRRAQEALVVLSSVLITRKRARRRRREPLR
jgi:transcriptional regulator with XRE-family HTH domain